MRASDVLFYARCPRCNRPMQRPFNAIGGPQIAYHFCGEAYQPARTHFVIAASGTGYMSYDLTGEESWEGVFERMIRHWVTSVRTTVYTEAA